MSICSVEGCASPRYSIGIYRGTWAPLCAHHRRIEADLQLAWLPVSRETLIHQLAMILAAPHHFSGLRDAASTSTVGLIPFLKELRPRS